MFKRSVYLKLPFLGAVFVGQRAQPRSGPFLSREWERGEWLLWAGRLGVIWTPAKKLAAERAA
ncbi:hypothetical protein FRZ44_33470 [Hypericibacter terrae]|uniref:Uncharacterized protein n=1 Tax=Hypericibacter terrae TaxID=2602015 RepID=A0A5J6MKW3_9PROT|nr:hypothetical protein [Hypericibacter terrae]QEX18043.1 hypothetical protein FRZ44_33470 [Hypericibacter terrae]